VSHSAGLLIGALKGGHKILVCGNGGSAADAQHMAAELVGRFERERAALPAVALTTDSSILTAWANDYGYDTVFARQVEALGQPGDALVGISTSGNSPSVLQALRVAQQRGLTCVALTGRAGGQLAALAGVCSLVVPAEETARIQEVHITVIHIWAKLIEEALS
jgi:phosphoheptose isomerase